MPPKSKSKTAQGPSGLDTLKAQLREGQPGRLYLFHGEEVYLRDHYVNQLKALLLPQGLEDFNLHTAQGKDCSVEWIQQAVDCLPMMSQRTLVLVTDFDLYGQGEKGREALAQLFSDLPDYCCLVFVYDLLAYKADGRSKLAAARSRATCSTGSPATSRPPATPSPGRTPGTSPSCAGSS